MGFVNSPSFPTAGSQPEPKPKKSKKVEPIVEETLPEECCAQDCGNCEHSEEVTE